jgi:glycosyltransferase involved in cell wall biosynthesis
VCRRLLFVNGSGGARARRADGTWTPYRRKGLDLVIETARRLPGVPFLVRSLDPVRDRLPSNVEVLPPTERNEDLYEEGDVCVQPSRWEGVGLPLLECQASGLPLVTTDAPPMNEFRPFLRVPADYRELVYLQDDHPVTSHLISPGRLASVLGGLVGRDLTAASLSARRFVETFHSWEQGTRLIRDSLGLDVPAGPGRCFP